jgi:hypothetical protein
VRLDKKATSISLLLALGVRRDGQKVLLAIKNMGGESEAAWRALLDNLVARGLKTPELVIVDGSSGLDKALAALWADVPVQRCTVHKHRNLLAHAPLVGWDGRIPPLGRLALRGRQPRPGHPNGRRPEGSHQTTLPMAVARADSPYRRIAAAHPWPFIPISS